MRDYPGFPMIFGATRESVRQRYPELFGVTRPTAARHGSKRGKPIVLTPGYTRAATRTRGAAPQPGGRSRRAERDEIIRRAMAGITAAATASPPPSRRDSVRWDNCVHEAGHLVVGHALGMIALSAAASDRYSGHNLVLLAGGSHRDRAILSFAGTAAEERSSGRSTVPSGPDIRIAERCIRDLAPGFYDGARRQDLFAACRREAGALVARHWPTIERVASSLYTAGELDEQELGALLP